MNITCPECSLSKEVGAVRLPAAGAPATCPFCGARFTVKPERPRSWLLRWKRPIAALTVALVVAVLLIAHDWKLDKNYFLQPGAWQGNMTYLGKKHPFELVIEKAQDGKLEGYMDWVEMSPRYRLAVRGTYVGNHLLFEDYAFLERSGSTGLYDKKDVYIIGNEMTGTDKNGSAAFQAVKKALPTQ